MPLLQFVSNACCSVLYLGLARWRYLKPLALYPAQQRNLRPEMYPESAFQFAVVIPASRPADTLVDLVRKLAEAGVPAIVVVDDGNAAQYQDVLSGAAAVRSVHVLRHAVTLGRGAALKTAIDYAVCLLGDMASIVTADADSQADDILRVAAALRECPGSLILGCRSSSREASLRRRVEGIASRGIAYALSRQKLADPQTGLRGIPAKLLGALLTLDASGPGFEFEMLMAARQLGVPIAEIPIQATWHPGPLSPVKAAVHGMFIAKTRTGPVWLFCALAAIVFAIIVGVEVHGFTTSKLFSQDIWFPLGLKRFMRYAAGFLVLAVPLLVLVPWSFAGVIASLLLVLTIFAVGPLPPLATAFFLISACALGSTLLGRKRCESVDVHLCATLLGMGVYIFVMTFLARLPVNYPVVWGVLVAVPIAFDFQGVRQRLTYWLSTVRGVALQSGWERAAFAFLAFILVAHWFVTIKPEAGVDALAVHLAVPMNIAGHHRMTYVPNRFLWSVMPMGADWSYSIVYLWGGEYASRLLNFSMLLAIVGLVYCAARRWVSRGTAFLLAASFAASPIVQVVTGSLFVENLLAALVLGMMTAIWHFGETGDRKFLFLAMGLGGTAMATKLGALAFVLIALPFAMAEMVRHWKSLGRRPLATCALAFLLLLMAGLPPYVIAWRTTRDPIFPYHNRQFPSNVVGPDVSFDDARFHIPLRLRTLYIMTFHSSQAYEGQDGSFGFQYLIVASLAILGLLVVKGRPALSGAVLAVGAAVLIMRSQPNARYLYPAMPVLLVPFAGLLGWMNVNQRWMYRTLIASIVICTAFDTYFLPSGSYWHKEFFARLPFSHAERERNIGETAPVRRVIAYYNQHHPHSTVLLTGESSIAGLEGDIYMNHWHQYPTQERLNGAKKLADMFRLIQSWKIDYFISRKPSPGDEVKPPMLRALLDVCTTPEFEFGDYYLAHLDPGCDPREVTARPPANPILVPHGDYDDFDPAIALVGEWERDTQFADAYHHTITYTDAPGAGIRFAFEGKSVTYMFTKAPNRGIASITIDHTAKGNLDLYSPNVEWQSRYTFCCLSAGRHLLEISVTGRKHPKSSGTFLDLDSFIVR